MKPFLLRHLQGETRQTERHPVWLMRQAGRFLQSYRDIRAKASFWEMVTNPELASKVSLLPIDELDVDAVIFFSDILTLPYGFGLPIELKESVGPVNLKALTSTEDFERFTDFEAKKHTPFVGEAFQRILKQLDSEKALIGFAGAPWTVAAYLVSSNPKTKFDDLKAWAYRDPKGLARGLEVLGDATVNYLQYQLDQGAHLVQLFETWASEIPRHFFVAHYAPILESIFGRLKGPRIYFPKGAYHLLDVIRDFKVDALGVDPMVSLSDFHHLTGKKFALQGNLDPLILLSDEKTVRRETQKLLKEAKKIEQPVILNLGHGVRKETPVSNVKAFIEEAKKT